MMEYYIGKKNTSLNICYIYIIYIHRTLDIVTLLSETFTRHTSGFNNEPPFPNTSEHHILNPLDHRMISPFSIGQTFTAPFLDKPNYAMLFFAFDYHPMFVPLQWMVAKSAPVERCFIPLPSLVN